jgi:hypothetical protein
MGINDRKIHKSEGLNLKVRHKMRVFLYF